MNSRKTKILFKFEIESRVFLAITAQAGLLDSHSNFDKQNASISSFQRKN